MCIDQCPAMPLRFLAVLVTCFRRVRGASQQLSWGSRPPGCRGVRRSKSSRRAFRARSHWHSSNRHVCVWINRSQVLVRASFLIASYCVVLSNVQRTTPESLVYRTSLEFVFVIQVPFASQLLLDRRARICASMSFAAPDPPTAYFILPPFSSLANVSQEVEDLNVMHKFDKRLERLAMVMPLTSLFDPGVAAFAHEHLQVRERHPFRA